jgi:hypothetical protein
MKAICFGGGVVAKTRKEHATEDALEEYALGRLRGAALARLEEHLLVCEECQDRLSQLDTFVQGMADADGLLDYVGFSHDTADGEVNLEATRLHSRAWLARFRGAHLDGSDTFESLRDAFRFLRRSFAEMYPEHRCTRRCVGGLKKPCRP